MKILVFNRSSQKGKSETMRITRAFLKQCLIFDVRKAV